jgi:hypothetical protein
MSMKLEGPETGIELGMAQKWQMRATRIGSRVKHASTNTRDAGPHHNSQLRLGIIDSYPNSSERKHCK